MKNYLGLGLLFKAVDKGLEKSIQSVAQGMVQATGAMEDAGKAAEGKSKKGGLFGPLAEGLKLLSLGKITSSLDSMKDSLQGSANNIDVRLS